MILVCFVSNKNADGIKQEIMVIKVLYEINKQYRWNKLLKFV